MKKLLISFSLLVFQFSISNAQTWDSLGHGINDPTNCPDLPAWVGAMTDYNGTLFVGGEYDSAGGLQVNNFAQWNGVKWDSVENGVLLVPTLGPCNTGGITSEAVYNGHLYAGGVFYSTDFKGYGIAQWNGVKWDSVGLGMGEYNYIYAMQVYNGNLYVGGQFLGIPGTNNIRGIGEWNGINWDSLSGGTTGTIWTLATYNGELYAGGYFNSIGHTNAQNIAKWNGSNWAPVGIGIDDTVEALAVYNGNLYAGGSFKNAGGLPAKNIACWNGVSWSSVGGGISGVSVYALEQYGSILCAGGTFDSAGNQPVNNIAYWNSSTWSGMGSGITGAKTLTSVITLYATPSTLYVGGIFDYAGGIKANNIAQWSSPLAVNNLKDKSEIKIYPNPNNGTFTFSLPNANEKCTIEIYSVLGEKVTFGMLKQVQYDCMIDISNQPNGVYFYRVLTVNGNLIGEGKVVIEK